MLLSGILKSSIKNESSAISGHALQGDQDQKLSQGTSPNPSDSIERSIRQSERSIVGTEKTQGKKGLKIMIKNTLTCMYPSKESLKLETPESTPPEATLPEAKNTLSKEDDHVQRLIGATIDPTIASKYLGKIEFDHLGRVVGFPNDLDVDTFNEIERSQIQDPKIQGSHAARHSDIRPERDVMIQFMSELSEHKSPESTRMMNEVRQTWLSGSLDDLNGSKISLRSSLNKYTASSDKTIAEISNRAKKALRWFPEQTECNDNMYGRRFDSLIAHELIKDPPPSALIVSQKQSDYLKKYLLECHDVLPPDEQDRFLQDLAKRIGSDQRPWFSQTLELDAFLNSPSRDTMEQMLRPPTNGYDLIKGSYLAVQSSVVLRNLSFKIRNSKIMPPWMLEATSNYHEVVIKTRSTFPTGVVRETDSYGPRLAHHPPYEGVSNFRKGKSWADEQAPNMQTIGEDLKDGYYTFESGALTAGHAIVGGASGSANLLGFMNRYINSKDPAFSVEHAALNSGIFLTFDGGHSLNEVMAVEHSLNANRGGTYEQTKQNRGNALHAYQLNYQDLVKLMPPGADRDRVESAFDKALHGTIDYFRAYSYYGPAGPAKNTISLTS